jgi:Zn-dependent protease
MLRSFKLGTAFGIPLFVHPTFFLLPLWVLFSARGGGPVGVLFALALLVAVFGCVLLHELGHALAARFFGIPTRDITLYPIGGVARLESTGTTPAQELCIALAGPAVNLVIVALLTPLLVVLGVLTGLLGGLEPAPFEGGLLPLLAHFVAWLLFCNGLLVAFNLLPAFPMDGGRVLRALLALGLGNLRATEIAAPIGMLTALLIGAWGAFQGPPTLLLVALFVCFAGQMELRALRMQEARRRAAEAGPMPFAEPAVEPIFARVGSEVSRPGFTGLVWDRQRRVWVRWLDGHPVEVVG